MRCSSHLIYRPPPLPPTTPQLHTADCTTPDQIALYITFTLYVYIADCSLVPWWFWVKGHPRNLWNERADRLADLGRADWPVSCRASLEYHVPHETPIREERQPSQRVTSKPPRITDSWTKCVSVVKNHHGWLQNLSGSLSFEHNCVTVAKNIRACV